MVRFELFRNRRLYIFLGIAMILAGAVWTLKAYDPHARFLASYEDIDINSGQVRHTRYLCWLCVRNDVEDTWLSRAADRHGPAEWHGVYSRIYVSPLSVMIGCGRSIHQIQLLQSLDKWVTFDASARKQIGNQVLLLWQQDAIWEVDEYISQLFVVVECLDDEGIEELAVEDLAGVSIDLKPSLTNE